MLLSSPLFYGLLYHGVVVLRQMMERDSKRVLRKMTFDVAKKRRTLFVVGRGARALDLLPLECWFNVFEFLCSSEASSVVRFRRVCKTFNEIVNDREWDIKGKVLRINDLKDVPLAWEISKVCGTKVTLSPISTEIVSRDENEDEIALPVEYRQARVVRSPGLEDFSLSECKEKPPESWWNLGVDTDGLMRCMYRRYDLIEHPNIEDPFTIYSEGLWKPLTEGTLAIREQRLDLYLRLDELQRRGDPSYTPMSRGTLHQ